MGRRKLTTTYEQRQNRQKGGQKRTRRHALAGAPHHLARFSWRLPAPRARLRSPRALRMSSGLIIPDCRDCRSGDIIIRRSSRLTARLRTLAGTRAGGPRVQRR